MGKLVCVCPDPDCEKLLDLEGVSTINAVDLFIAIGCGDAGVFKSGRDAAACIGLTPLQHASGGKTNIGSIEKGIKNVAVRSYLYQTSTTLAGSRQLACPV